MKCQDCCPANVQNRDNFVNGAVFTEDESMELLNNTDDEKYSKTLKEKIETIGDLSTWVKVLPRNLSALLRNID